MLFIFSRRENGSLLCEQMTRDAFPKWLEENTDGVMPEYQPVFLDRMPEDDEAGHAYCIIDGSVIVPRPVKVVTEYELPKHGR